MSTTVIDLCKSRASEALDYFLCAIRFVPEDKLTWSPSPTAKSTLQIAAHCAGYSHGFARVLAAHSFPSDVEDFLNPIHQAINSITTIREAEDILRDGIAQTLLALDAVPSEMIGARIKTPQGDTPFRFFMTIPSAHLTGHAYQSTTFRPAGTIRSSISEPWSRLHA